MLSVDFNADVKQKIDELEHLYNKINESTKDRNYALEQTLDTSEKFWDDYNDLVGTLKDLQESLTAQEVPSLEPAILREQREELEVRIYV